MFLFHLYIYFLFECKFEVWRKKTHLILFQVGFFFNIYKFYFFLFFTLYLVSSFLEFFFLLNFFYCISLSLFHLFPFLFYSFCVFTFFLVYVFIFSILILSIFIFFYFYVFIYYLLFSFFFFKKILVFLICSIMKITALPYPAALPHAPKQTDPSFLETWNEKVWVSGPGRTDRQTDKHCNRPQNVWSKWKEK